MFRSSTIIRELVLSLAKVMLEHLCPYRLCGGVAACLGNLCLYDVPYTFFGLMNKEDESKNVAIL
jgi:hypothetical protein